MDWSCRNVVAVSSSLQNHLFKDLPITYPITLVFPGFKFQDKSISVLSHHVHPISDSQTHTSDILSLKFNDTSTLLAGIDQSTIIIYKSQLNVFDNWSSIHSFAFLDHLIAFKWFETGRKFQREEGIWKEQSKLGPIPKLDSEGFVAVYDSGKVSIVWFDYFGRKSDIQCFINKGIFGDITFGEKNEITVVISNNSETNLYRLKLSFSLTKDDASNVSVEKIKTVVHSSPILRTCLFAQSFIVATESQIQLFSDDLNLKYTHFTSVRQINSSNLRLIVTTKDNIELLDEKLGLVKYLELGKVFDSPLGLIHVRNQKIDFVEKYNTEVIKLFLEGSWRFTEVGEVNPHEKVKLRCPDNVELHTDSREIDCMALLKFRRNSLSPNESAEIKLGQLLDLLEWTFTDPDGAEREELKPRFNISVLQETEHLYRITELTIWIIDFSKIVLQEFFIHLNTQGLTEAPKESKARRGRRKSIPQDQPSPKMSRVVSLVMNKSFKTLYVKTLNTLLLFQNSLLSLATSTEYLNNQIIRLFAQSVTQTTSKLNFPKFVNFMKLVEIDKLKDLIQKEYPTIFPPKLKLNGANGVFTSVGISELDDWCASINEFHGEFCEEKLVGGSAATCLKCGKIGAIDLEQFVEECECGGFWKCL